jgi:hypothetical protein
LSPGNSSSRPLFAPVQTVHGFSKKTLRSPCELPESSDGVIVPAFTSETELVKWTGESSPYMALDGKSLLELLLSSDWAGILIDAGEKNEAFIERSDAADLLGLR